MTIALVQSVAVQSAAADTGNFALPVAPAAGNLLIAQSCGRGSSVLCITGGLVVIQEPVIFNATKGDSRVSVFSGISNGGNVFDFRKSDGNNTLSVIVSEWSGIDQVDTSSAVANQGPAQSLVLPGVTPNPAKSTALLVDAWGFATDTFGSFSVTAGWTKLFEGMTSGGLGPSSVFAYKIVAPPAGAVPATADCGQTQGWGGVSASFTKLVDSKPPFAGEPGGGVW